MGPRLLDRCSLSVDLRLSLTRKRMAKRETSMVMDTEVWIIIVDLARESNIPICMRSVIDGGKTEDSVE